MKLSTSSLITLVTLAAAAPSGVPSEIAALTSYAPIPAICPSTSLVRLASSGVSPSEQKYIASRKTKASTALKAWLSSTGSHFPPPSKWPTLGLTSSGGGYRALLCGAGVHQAFDSRDSNVSTSGLYQALTYEAGLSGGSWLLSSISANNWPTVSSLMTGLWEEAFQDGLELPDGPLAAVALAKVTTDIVAKDKAGFPPTLTDPWGRLLAYQLLYGSDGGVTDQVSGITGLSNFTSHAVPFPIITSLGVKTWEGECLPGPNATQYEFTPYEFGSWDSGVAAFTQTKYLGSSLSNGKPTTKGVCVTGYDNQGYVLGTSSNLFNEACLAVPATNLTSNTLVAELEAILDTAHEVTTRDEYAVYPNPFYNLTSSWRVSAQPSLELVDGGEALQNNPIWPMLHRDVDVLIVNDNSADTSTNFPNGSEILTTYVQAVAAGLTRMPVIPSVETFVEQGLNQRPTFFGCNDKNVMTIVYMPNVNYTFASNVPTAQLEYSAEETREMVANGVLIGSYGGNSTWGTCLGCGIMKKTGVKLPSACTACFKEFCYN